MFIKKTNKKRSINPKHQFNCVYDYIIDIIKDVDKETAILFCDYVIDIMCKNIESNMQLDFINQNVDDFVLSFHENEYENKNSYSPYIWFPVGVTVNGKRINIETDSTVDVDLAKCHLFCNTRKTNSLLELLKKISNSGFHFDKDRHRAMYIEYLNICTFVNDGVHSLSIAHHLQQGKITAKLMDITAIFPYISTDGDCWYVNDDTHNEYIAEDYRFCLVYEIAKLKYSLEDNEKDNK